MYRISYFFGSYSRPAISTVSFQYTVPSASCPLRGARTNTTQDAPVGGNLQPTKSQLDLLYLNCLARSRNKMPSVARADLVMSSMLLAVVAIFLALPGIEWFFFSWLGLWRKLNLHGTEQCVRFPQFTSCEGMLLPLTALYGVV